METRQWRAEDLKVAHSSVAAHLRRVGVMCRLRRVGVMCRLRLVVEVHPRRSVAMNYQAIGFALMNHPEPVVVVHRGASMARRRAVDWLDRALALTLTRHQPPEHSAIDHQDYESEGQNSVVDAKCPDRLGILHSEYRQVRLRRERCPALRSGLQRHRMHRRYQYSLANLVHPQHLERAVDCD
jgi:hypothetical protein